MNIKDITIPLIIHYYLREHSEHYTNPHAKSLRIRFLHVVAGALAYAIRVRAKPCVHRFNYSRTLRREVPVRAVDIVNPGIQ